MAAIWTAAGEGGGLGQNIGWMSRPGIAAIAQFKLALVEPFYYQASSADPVSIYVDTFGTGKIDQLKLVEIVRENFQMTPRGIIDSLKLRRPIFKKTAAYGHFGRNEPDFSWEATDKADALRSAAGVGAEAVTV